MPSTRRTPTPVICESAKPFAVGDRVFIKFGPVSLMSAEILEDRGLYGPDRHRIYRVRTIDTEPSEPVSFEVRAENVMPAPRRRRAVRAS